METLSELLRKRGRAPSRAVFNAHRREIIEQIDAGHTCRDIWLTMCEAHGLKCSYVQFTRYVAAAMKGRVVTPEAKAVFSTNEAAQPGTMTNVNAPLTDNKADDGRVIKPFVLKRMNDEDLY